MDYGLFGTIFSGFGLGEGLLALIAIALSGVAITRDTRSIGLLAFPLSLGWSRAGLPVDAFILVGAAIVTTITLFGLHNLGSVIRNTGESLGNIPFMQNYDRAQRRSEAIEERAFADEIARDTVGFDFLKAKRKLTIREQVKADRFDLDELKNL